MRGGGIVGGACGPTACIECDSLVLVKAFMPSRLNGKRNVAPHAPPNPRCPRNGTVDEAALLARSGFNPGAHATGSSRFREGRRGRIRQPGYRPTSGRSLVLRPCRTCPRGSGSRAVVRALSPCRSSATGCARRGPRFACFSSFSPLSAAAQTRLDPVTITATREPQALSRSNADIVVIDAETIRNSSADSVEDLLRRAAGVQITRNGGPGQTSGYFVRGTGTSSTVVLVDGVRIGSATLGQAEFEALSLAADRAHRGAARPGVQPLRRRRRRRRDPDLHPARRGRAARHRRRGDRRLPLARRATSASAARKGRSTTPSRSPARRATASRRSGPATRSAPSIPTTTASRASRGACVSAGRRPRAIGSASACSRAA